MSPLRLATFAVLLIVVISVYTAEARTRREKEQTSDLENTVRIERRERRDRVKRTERKDRKDKKERRRKWWAIGVMPLHSNSTDRDNRQRRRKILKSLTAKQRHLVDTTYIPHLLDRLQLGTMHAWKSCAAAFKHRWWNCSTLPNPTKGRIFGKFPSTGSRETAFLYAISSAAITFTLAQPCLYSHQSGYKCVRSCTSTNETKNDSHIMLLMKDNNKKRHAEYGVAGASIICEHELNQAISFASRFVTRSLVKTKNKERYSMDKHNYLAGIQMVKESVFKACRCPLLTAPLSETEAADPASAWKDRCKVVTCNKYLPNLSYFRSKLKQRFDGATRVAYNRREKKLKPKVLDHKSPEKSDLVYIEDSLESCQRNVTYGIFGIEHRDCSPDSQGVDSCTILCCNNGFESYTHKYTEACNCEFVYCCEVTCDQCNREEKRYRCKAAAQTPLYTKK